ncbi:MAG: hypothetical protein NC827_03695 [Candidatus Omnitrophica bacterium]|nr:hypothetical protein [Candidatus Omnitrophota bacterium]MCM8802397.1 hypothetical protein [Candidatus Omnitrophota bacterium]
MEIYKQAIKIKKKEIFLFLLTFLYVFLRSLFFDKFKSYYFFIFIFEVYYTISIYTGIKKSVYDETFNILDIFKEGLYFFPSILLYNLFVSLVVGLIYSITLSTVSSIKILSNISFLLFFIIIIWAAIPFFYIFLTIYTPFIILVENDTVFESLKKSYKFIRENLPHLINLFFPFFVFWIFLFTSFQKSDKIYLLMFILLLFISFLEILTIKTVFLVYKGVKNERNF